MDLITRRIRVAVLNYFVTLQELFCIKLFYSKWHCFTSNYLVNTWSKGEFRTQSTYFAKTLSWWKQLPIFTTKSILDIRLCSEYPSLTSSKNLKKSTFSVIFEAILQIIKKRLKDFKNFSDWKHWTQSIFS